MIVALIGTGGARRIQIARSGLMLLLAAATAGCGAPALVATPGVRSPGYALQIDRGRNIVRPLVARGSGVAVAVGVNGELVWSEGFGSTARDGGEAVQPDARFRVYSLMKQITAVLALQGAARGDVSLTRPVREYMPALPAHYDGVTLRQLLTHTAAVRHYHDEAEAATTAHCATAAEALPLFIEDPLIGTPGGRESYSTWGFVLASAVLERQAGVPFHSLLDRDVLQPAGMTSTRLEGDDDVSTRLTYYDVNDAGEVSRTPDLDNSCKMGGGGFVASAEDIVRFHNAVLRGDLVPLPAVRQMLGGRTSLLAAGSGPGGHAVSQVDLESGISVVVLSNTSGLEQQIALERARDLLAAVFDSGA
jgi:serine beta-lactamase-like protein LACTB, mitochondrial